MAEATDRSLVVSQLVRDRATTERWGYDHPRAALWLGREVAETGLEASVRRWEPTAQARVDGGHALVLGGVLRVTVKHVPSLHYLGPDDYRWDTICFEHAPTLDLLRLNGALPHAYCLVAGGYEGFCFVTNAVYEDLVPTRYEARARKRVDQIDGITVVIPMAEVPRASALALDEFIDWADGRIIGLLANGAPPVSDDPKFWLPISTLPYPDLPAEKRGGGFVLGDPRADPQNCLQCGRPKPPGRPAYCRPCGKISRAYSASQAAPRPKPPPRTTARASGRMDWESEASLLDLIDQAMARTPRYGIKRADGSGRYRDVGYEDEGDIWDR
jgi:hypothetical protein